MRANTSFEGIEKKDFRNAFIMGTEIVITYMETYDHDAVSSTTFENQIEVEDNIENRIAIQEIFGVNVNAQHDYTVKTVRMPKETAIVSSVEVITTVWFTCPNCGCQHPYEIEGVKKLADIHYIITTECCETRINLKGKKDN